MVAGGRHRRVVEHVGRLALDFLVEGIHLLLFEALADAFQRGQLAVGQRLDDGPPTETRKRLRARRLRR